MHGASGAVDLWVSDEEGALAAARRFLSYLPASAFAAPPVVACEDPADRRDESLATAIPRNRRHPYLVRPLLEAIFNAGSVFEHCRYGGATVTARARLDGHPVGVLAGDPYAAGGALTAPGAEAMTRLVDLCDAFHLPLAVLTDQPGIAIGLAAERAVHDPRRRPRHGRGLPGACAGGRADRAAGDPRAARRDRLAAAHRVAIRDRGHHRSA